MDEDLGNGSRVSMFGVELAILEREGVLKGAEVEPFLNFVL